MTSPQNKGRKLTGLRPAQRPGVSFPSAARATEEDAMGRGTVLSSLSIRFHFSVCCCKVKMHREYPVRL